MRCAACDRLIKKTNYLVLPDGQYIDSGLCSYCFRVAEHPEIANDKRFVWKYEKVPKVKELDFNPPS